VLGSVSGIRLSIHNECLYIISPETTPWKMMSPVCKDGYHGFTCFSPSTQNPSIHMCEVCGRSMPMSREMERPAEQRYKIIKFTGALDEDPSTTYTFLATVITANFKNAAVNAILGHIGHHHNITHRKLKIMNTQVDQSNGHIMFKIAGSDLTMYYYE
jgi:hypothetical protein